MMKSLTVSIAALAIASAAHAASVSYDAAGYANAATNATGQPLQAQILLSKFDPALGSLRSITFSYAFSVSGSGNYGGIRIKPTDFSLLDKDGATILAVTSGTNLCGYPTSPYPFTCSTVPTTGTFGPLTDHSVLHSFTGAGNYALTYRGEPNVILWGAQVWGVHYDVGITYDYRTAAEMPEPANWALMLIGFGAVGGALRRRRTAGGKLALQRRLDTNSAA